MSRSKKARRNPKRDSAKAAPSKSIIYGFHAIKQLLESAPQRVIQVIVQSGRDDDRANDLYKLARAHEIELLRIKRSQLDERFAHVNHQGFVAEIRPATAENETFLENLLVDNPKPFLLILDQVQDPHNVGAILRSAAASGVDAVITPSRNSCGLTGAVRKVAVGAAELVPYVQVTNLARTIRMLQENGVFVIGLAGEAESDLFESTESGSLAIVMGNEAKGMRRLTREHCDQLIKIPMAGAVESLNVSVATGICLFHFANLRQA